MLYVLTCMFYVLIGGWAAATSNTNQWIQADLYRENWVSGIITRGRDDYNQWVTSYKVNSILEFLLLFYITGVAYNDCKGNGGRIDI